MFFFLFYKFLFFFSDFLKIQRKSFRSFLDNQLGTEFAGVPRKFSLKFLYKNYKFLKPILNIEEAILLSKTYCCHFYLPIQIISNGIDCKTKDIQWFFLGTLPLLTRRGHFIINGTPRVVLNQIARSPGVYFGYLNSSKKHQYFYAEIISKRGPWIRLEMDQKKRIWVSIQQSKKKKISFITFLKKFHIKSLDHHLFLRDKKSKFNLYFANTLFSSNVLSIKNQKLIEKNVHQFSGPLTSQRFFDSISQFILPLGSQKTYDKRCPCLRLNRLKVSEVALENVSTFGKLILTKNLHIRKRSHFMENFKNPKVPNNRILNDFPLNWIFKDQNQKNLMNFDFDLGKIGRQRLNQKCGILLQTTRLTPIDLLAISDQLAKFTQSFRFYLDDRDDLKNRRLKTIAELLQNQFARGIRRLQNNLMKQPTISLQKRISSQSLNSTLKEFFHSHQLSQYLDQSNPLAEITHKRRLSCLGAGGVNRENAGMEIRGIHRTHYGRICPIETPEGQNAGLVNSLTTAVSLNEESFLETPFIEIYKQHFQNQKKSAFFSVENQDIKKILLNSAFPKTKQNFSVPIFQSKTFEKCSIDSIELITWTPQQFLSIATTCIPFVEHNDANRALMGSNMQRQALPLIHLEQPFVSTFHSFRVLSDLKDIPTIQKSGFLFYVSNQKICFYTLKNPQLRLFLQQEDLTIQQILSFFEY